MPAACRSGPTRARFVLALLLLAGPAWGCSRTGGAGIDERSFERTLIERERITPDQARCVSRYVFAEYSDAEIRVIHDERFTALSSPRWSGYGHAMVACVIADGPEGESLAAPSSPSPTRAVRRP